MKHLAALGEALFHEFAARDDRDYLFFQGFQVVPIAYQILKRPSQANARDASP